MTSCQLKAMILACLLVGQAAPTRADDWGSSGRDGAAPLTPVTSSGTLQGAGPLAPQTAQTWGVGSTSQSLAQAPQGQWSQGVYAEPRVPYAQPQQPTAPALSGAVRLPMAGPATTVGGSVSANFVGPGQAVNGGPAASVSSANGVIPLPGTAAVTAGSGAGASAALSSPGQAVDGTWRDDGRYVIININGKETRLLKPAPEVGRGSVASQPTEEGTVQGRLAQGQHPLANCHVVLVPLKDEGKKNYVYDESRQPLTTITDSDGNYHFEHAPAGSYKLTWLPRGTTQWIRRLAPKPDVVVHGGQAVIVREISFAQRTIN